MPAVSPGGPLGVTGRAVHGFRCSPPAGRAAGNQTRAAEALGISRRWLSEKLDRCGIARSRQRDPGG